MTNSVPEACVANLVIFKGLRNRYDLPASAIFAPDAEMTAFPPILVILGPTARGNRRWRCGWQSVGAEILSVDSMQVYRGMDIGTAKPTPDEQARVRHHLIDVADPNETFAVSRFVEMADEVIADAQQRGVPLIATGGTPMYYKALFEGLFEGPGADRGIRESSAGPMQMSSCMRGCTGRSRRRGANSCERPQATCAGDGGV